MLRQVANGLYGGAHTAADTCDPGRLVCCLRGHAYLVALSVRGDMNVPIVSASARSSPAAAAQQVIAAHPELNVLVTMAGIMPVEDWRNAGGFLGTAEAVVATNLLGPIRLIAAFVGQLRSRPGSTTVTVSSGLAHVPLVAAVNDGL